jgi:hypothetical protein
VKSATRVDLALRDNRRSEQGFRIERTIGTGARSPIGEAPAHTAAIARRGLQPNTTARARVRAVQAAGTSPRGHSHGGEDAAVGGARKRVLMHRSASFR